MFTKKILLSAQIQFHHTSKRFSTTLKTLSSISYDSNEATGPITTTYKANPVSQFFKQLNSEQVQKLVSQFMEVAESEGYFSKNTRDVLLGEKNIPQLQQFLLHSFGIAQSEKTLFLGRETVKLCIADYLYGHFPFMEAEQKMNILLQLSKQENVVKLARQNLRLNEFIEQQSSNAFERADYEQFISNLFYRMVGTLQLQFNLLFARDFVIRHLLRKSVDITSLMLVFDPKAELANKIHSGAFKANNVKKGQSISYEVKSFKPQDQRVTGAAFAAKAYAGNVLLGEGQGPTRTIAEMKAAEDALFKYFCRFEDAYTPIQKEYLNKE